ncbi:MAG: TatD family hydrolase [Mycoplasmatales bacterium]
MIDSHIHLNLEQYKDDLEDVIKIAKESGVKKVVLIGCGKKGIQEILEIYKKDPDFFILAGGFHPVDVSEYCDADLKKLEETILTGKLSSIGEIGLDYHWYPEQKEIQMHFFVKQIELAKKYDLPIIVHSRDAYEDCYDVLRKYAPVKGVMHSFADNSEMAKKFTSIGMKIGLSGPITFKNGISQKNVAKTTSMNDLLIETDGPYLTPEPFRGKRNRPEYIKYVAQEIAFQKNCSLEEVLLRTEKNTLELFGKE